MGESDKLGSPVSADEAMLRSVGVALHGVIEEIGRSSEATERIKAADREKQRESDRDIHRINARLYAFFGALIVGLIAYALHLGKDALAQELTKTILTLIVGGIGGYGVAALRMRKDE